MSSQIEKSLVQARDFASGIKGHFISGEHVSSDAEAALETVDPSTGSVWARVSEGGAVEIDQAVKAASEAFKSWSQSAPRDREKLLRRFGDILERDADILAAIDAIDCGTLLRMMQQRGKTLWLDAVDYFAGCPTKVAGQAFAPFERGQTAGRITSFSTILEPIGVVGCILPWNAPATFVITKAMPALAAGCTVVVKPAEQTPISALFIAEMLREAGFPEGVFNVVNGMGPTAGAALAGHPLIKKISFTGSTAVGRAIAHSGADTFKRLTLELGGKSAFIVMADADIELAARTAAMSGYFLSGQFCMCPSRLFVDSKVEDRFIERLSHYGSALKVGSAYATDTMMGPLISREDCDRVAGVVETARSQGCEVIYGGAAIGNDGFFFEPTLIHHKDTKPDIAHQETFGPVLSTIPFEGDDLGSLVEMANNTDYGLTASVWTRDLAVAQRFAAKLEAGSVGVNDHAPNDPMIPFGGVKASGVGREFGKDGFESFYELKTISMCVPEDEED